MELTTRISPTAPVPATSAEQDKLIVQGQDAFQWINSEGLLRDEGALFGIAAADITDKLNAIASYFKTRAASEAQKKQYLDQKMQEIDLVLSISRKELEKVKSNSGEVPRPVNNVLPLLFQVLAIVSVCVFNFFLVKWWLSPAIGSDIICLGIYLFGLFSVYMGRGLIQQLPAGGAAEKRETPDDTGNPVPKKKEGKFPEREFSVAVVVALFICTLTFRFYPLEHTVAAFLLLFILFLGGKVLINTLLNLREEAAGWLRFISERFTLQKKEKRLTKSIQKSEAFLDKTRLELIEPATILKKLEAEQEYKTRVFLSEYNLALQSRAASTKSQAKQFV